MLDFKGRKWLITIDRSLLGVRYTHDEIKRILSDLRLDYWCMSDEWYQQNYYTLVFIYCSKPIFKSLLLALFPDTSLYAVKGCCKENRMFVWKEGVFKEKFPCVISLRKTREQWHSKSIGLNYVLWE